eukprot:5035425-Pyramimonas_sp.AAC.1
MAPHPPAETCRRAYRPRSQSGGEVAVVVVRYCSVSPLRRLHPELSEGAEAVEQAHRLGALLLVMLANLARLGHVPVRDQPL